MLFLELIIYLSSKIGIRTVKSLNLVFKQSDVIWLGESGDFTTNVDAKTAMQLYKKLSCKQ